MAVIFNLYRLSLTGDDKTTLDRIDFNDPAATNFKDASKENAWLTEVSVMSTHAIGDNQPAETDQGSKDELGNAEKQYTLTIKIKNTFGDSSDGQNDFLVLLDVWDSEPSQINNWPEGRFGIEDIHNVVNSLVPVRTGTNQKGLIWQSYSRTDNLAKNETDVIITLQTSKGDGT